MAKLLLLLLLLRLSAIDAMPTKLGHESHTRPYCGNFTARLYQLGALYLCNPRQLRDMRVLSTLDLTQYEVACEKLP
jgi:hypothetical protein